MCELHLLRHQRHCYKYNAKYNEGNEPFFLQELTEVQPMLMVSQGLVTF